MSLIAWWPLNGNSKNYGSLGNALQPTENSVTYVDGKIGRAMHTGSLNLTANQWKQIIGNTISIAMWIYTRNDGTYNKGTQFFGNGGMTKPNNRKFAMFHYDTKTNLHCSWQHDDQSSSDNPSVYWSCHHKDFFTVGEWVHLCVVQDAENEKITVYRNGSQYSVSTVTGLANMNIKSAGDAPLRNNIDYQHINDIRIYNHALSKKEVREIYKTKLIDFDFSNNKINNADDLIYNSAGYGNDGMGVSLVKRGIGSNIGEKAFVFNGSNSYIEFPSFKKTFQSSDFTIEFSLNPAESGVRDVIFGDYELSGSTQFNIERNSGSYSDNRLRIYTDNGVTDNGITECILPANTWTQVAITYNKASKTMKVYKNGSPVKTLTNIDITKTKSEGSSYPWRIGSDGRSDSTRYNGKMSFFRIYATTLSDNDILESYKTRIQVSRNGSLFSHKINEYGVSKDVVFDYKMNTQSNSVSEVYISYDNEIYYEDDGSMWVRLFHHNNPASSKFSKSDTFSTSVWKSKDQWFNMSFCKNVNKWELMVKQRLTSGAEEFKYRWVQSKNPTTAVFGDVDNVDITHITSKTKSGRIPNIYQEVEYIENASPQCINTEYAFKTDNTRIDADIMIVTNNAYQSLWGNEEYLSNGSRYFSAIPHGINGSFGLYLGSGSPVGSTTLPIGTRHKFEFESNKNGSTNYYSFKKDGTVLLSGTYGGSINTLDNMSKTSSTSTTMGHFFIFANHNTSYGASNSSTQEIKAMRVYSFKMYDDGTKVRDFIPCYRKSDNKTGLYCTVTRKFYTDWNGGNFSKGPDATISYNSTSYGGMYCMNSDSTYLSANNGNSGNWWGAVGAFTGHQSGIPAWNGQVVTTGYMDVYLRIDNVNLDISSLSDTNFKSYSHGEVYSPNIYEY